MFIAHHRVRLHETDMVGIIFFANQFRFINDAFEEFGAHEGFTIRSLLENEDYVFVIRHAEGDYLAPLVVGDYLDIHVSVESIGQTSFIMQYQIYRLGELVGKARTVHVTLDKETRHKIPVPDKLRNMLEKHLAKVS